MIKAILLITLILDEIYIFVIKQDHYWSDKYLPLLMRHLISPLLRHSAHSLGIVISKFKRLFYCLWILDFFLKKICVKYQLPDRRVFIVCQLNQSRKISTGPERAKFDQSGVRFALCELWGNIELIYQGRSTASQCQKKPTITVFYNISEPMCKVSTGICGTIIQGLATKGLLQSVVNLLWLHIVLPFWLG